MRRIPLTLILLVSPVLLALGQNRLYRHTFPLGDVVLTQGPFKHARDLNLSVLLQYDADRLLAGYREQAGLPAKASRYPNWEGLDGHVGGHYLSALAMHYASTGDAECKRRMTYMIAELKACQDANTLKYPRWGNGYAGAVPNSNALWSAWLQGDFTLFHSAWVPWYNLHKTYAGLRDAWLYAGDDEALGIFLKFCDWAIRITAPLSDTQMQTMLDTEHGGMNEILADAFQITGREEYLVAARRFSHNVLLNALAAGRDELDNKHANTQVPKAVGFHRIGLLANDRHYQEAGEFFWTTVTTHRTLAFGGNSRREFFPAAMACGDFVHEAEGPESCNSYNMLKLSESLFSARPSVRYIDYYERTLYNHILSTQHPVHGGYVYFTPARPRHYRVYSSPNHAMWCCVGSGMENHGKYNQLIYTHTGDSLYWNLFVPSELHWRKKNVTLKQETSFPDDEHTRLTVTEGSASFTLLIRYPSWVKAGAARIRVNGKHIHPTGSPGSYLAIQRKWKTGDVVDVTLPMHTTLERMPNVPQYVAMLHGPILLAARTGTTDLKGLIADDSRWAHIASGEKLPIDKAPIIVSNNTDMITKGLIPIEGKPLTFRLPDVKIVNPLPIVLEPFFRIHDARYSMYWMMLSEARYTSYVDSTRRLEAERLAIGKRTLDFVAPGEQQPEADHRMLVSNSNTGNRQNEFWRDAGSEGYFSYSLATGGETDLTLRVRYWGAEWGNRTFDIYIDDAKLATEDNTNRWNQSQFFEVDYTIPNALVKGKAAVRVKFQAAPKSTAGAVYYVRLLRGKPAQ